MAEQNTESVQNTNTTDAQETEVKPAPIYEDTESKEEEQNSDASSKDETSEADKESSEETDQNKDESDSKEESSDDSKDDKESKESEDSKDEKDSKEKEEGAPEKYDLKLSEKSLLDKSSVDEISTFARERGLSNKLAQEILEMKESAVKEHIELQAEAVAQRTSSWRKAVEDDKEIGGEKLKETANLANQVAKRFGTETFMKALNDTGLGNHPELVRVFARIGRAMDNDKLELGGNSFSQSGRSEEQTFYPNMFKENE